MRSTDRDLDPKASDYNHQSYCDGCRYYDDGDFNKAKRAFSDSIEYWPEDVQAWFALGNCYDELNKPSKSEECYRRVLELSSDSENSNVFYNLGNSLLDQAKFEEAVFYYQMVISKSEAYHSAHINMARAKNGNANKNS